MNNDGEIALYDPRQESRAVDRGEVRVAKGGRCLENLFVAGGVGWVLSGIGSNGWCFKTARQRQPRIL